MRTTLAIIIATLLAILGAEAKKAPAADTKAGVKREQTATTKAIKQTRREIDANARATTQQLNHLNSIRADITRRNDEIAQMAITVDSLDNRIATVADSITILEQEIMEMRAVYVKHMRRLQATMQSMSPLTFILSGRSFKEVWQRVRYIRRYDAWRRERSQRIVDASRLLDSRRSQLDADRARRARSINDLNLAAAKVRQDEATTATLVSQLQSRGKDLRATLAEQETRARQLDDRLGRLIEAERRAKPKPAPKPKEKPAAKPATKPTTKPAPKAAAPDRTPPPPPPVAKAPDTAPVQASTFAASKGRLLFPVSGSYRIVKGFGRQQHPDLRNVVTDNPGIDIETGKGARARAVYAGTVSGVFSQPGYNTIVMVRHGDYLTIYANLAGVSVKTGDSVSAGQAIGTVWADPADGGRSVLHFEVRREREKLNPLAWLAR